MLATAPNDLDALVLKCDLEIALGRRDDAIQTLERVDRGRPDCLPARYSLVSSLVQAKQTRPAAAQVDAREEAGAERSAHAARDALVAFARGDNTAALDAVQKSVQAAPDYPARALPCRG